MSRRICLFFGTLLILSQIFLFMIHHERIRMLLLNDKATLSDAPPSLKAGTNTLANDGIAQRRLLVHLHIGKNGGTSLDGLLRKLAKQTHYQYKGFRHFDWSEIDAMMNTHNTLNVVTMLRNPVDRAISHYYSAKIWMKNQHFKTSTLQEYLNDTNLMLSTRSIWMDGQAGVSWLTGTHTEEWVVGALNKTEVTRRENLYKNHTTEMCHLAANRLDQTLWFGLLNDLPRSMELLQHVLGLNETPYLPRGNKNPLPKPDIQENERQALASLMPMDVWLYNYGKLLLDARYQAMLTGVFVPPKRPPLPSTWSCTSTSNTLDCIDGPLKGSYRLQQYAVLRRKRPDVTTIALNMAVKKKEAANTTEIK